MQIVLTHSAIIGKQSPEQRTQHRPNWGKAGEAYNLAEEDAKTLLALGVAKLPEPKSATK